MHHASRRGVEWTPVAKRSARVIEAFCAEGIGGAATDKNLKRSPCPAPRPALAGQLRCGTRLCAGICFDPALALVGGLIFFEPNVIAIEDEVFDSRPVAL